MLQNMNDSYLEGPFLQGVSCLLCQTRMDSQHEKVQVLKSSPNKCIPSTDCLFKLNIIGHFIMKID